jgi:hypothetical protein
MRATTSCRICGRCPQGLFPLNLLARAFDVFPCPVDGVTCTHTNQQRGRRKRDKDYSFNHILSFVHFGCPLCLSIERLSKPLTITMGSFPEGRSADFQSAVSPICNRQVA